MKGISDRRTAPPFLATPSQASSGPAPETPPKRDSACKPSNVLTHAPARKRIHNATHSLTREVLARFSAHRCR